MVKIPGHCCSHKTQACNCTPCMLCLYTAHLSGRMVIHYFYGVMRWGTPLWSKEDCSLIFKTTHYAANIYQTEQPAWPLWYAQHDLNMLRPYLSLKLTHFNSESQGVTAFMPVHGSHWGKKEKKIKMGTEGRRENNTRNCATVIRWIIKLAFTDFLIRKGNPVINMRTSWLVHYITETYNPTSYITVSCKFPPPQKLTNNPIRSYCRNYTLLIS